MLNADEIRRLAEIVPPPVGCVATVGGYRYTLTGQNWRHDDGSSASPKTMAILAPDPTCHAWRMAMVDWLCERGAMSITAAGASLLAFSGVCPTFLGPDAIARLVLAVAEKDFANAEL